jgi:hypothetical protein
LVFILKDEDGNVTTFEFDQLEELAPFSTLQGEISGLTNAEDVAYAADSLAPNTSAAILVWEGAWSKGPASPPSSLKLPQPISRPATNHRTRTTRSLLCRFAAHEAWPVLSAAPR